MSEVPSPCVKVCVLDEERGYCIGCLRTLDEVCDWVALSNDERSDVLAKLAARRERLETTGSIEPPSS